MKQIRRLWNIGRRLNVRCNGNAPIDGIWEVGLELTVGSCKYGIIVMHTCYIIFEQLLKLQLGAVENLAEARLQNDETRKHMAERNLGVDVACASCH